MDAQIKETSYVKFEYTKGIIWSGKSTEWQTMQCPKEKRTEGHHDPHYLIQKIYNREKLKGNQVLTIQRHKQF